MDLAVQIHNEGKLAGTEVVQLYVQFAPNTPGAPLHALRGLDRVTVEPGQAALAHIHLRPEDLSHVDLSGKRIITAGIYSLWVGGGQPDTVAPGQWIRITVSGNQQLPD